ncbi:hypothetical protein KAX02_01530 [candidate division WOR-3 bacterium]|nr:hypothetical protein [candidate division WOR-3 bacterium]
MVWKEDISKEEPEDKQKIVYKKNITTKKTTTLEELYNRKSYCEHDIAQSQARMDKIQKDIDEIEALQVSKI